MIAASLCLLSACAGNQLKVEPIPESKDPRPYLTRLDADIGTARKNEIDVLAPTWFGKAEKSLKEAQKSLDRGEDSSKVFKKIDKGRAELQRAEELAQLSRIALSDAIEARGFARAAGAAQLGKDYAKVEGQFLELTKAIEGNKLSRVRRKNADVTLAFRRLELQAIKEQALGEARKLIGEAENAGAPTIAPFTFVDAQGKLAEADKFISRHRYQKETIAQKANNALFGARRALQVTRQTEEFQTMQPEQITLWFEGFLSGIASELSTPDLRDQTFEKQVETIVGSIKALRAEQADTEAMRRQLASLEVRARENQVAKERLTAERQFDQLFNEVQSYFRPDEAEVYNQGNRLVIRLKAFQFPVGKDFIVPGNYALLGKVQQAIRVFREPNVIIEGHTDSIGSDEANERLSQRRAQAVRQYLLANGLVTDERSVAVGYGSKRPLASNETAKGRAINRRIDLVIVPMRKDSQ
jgi:outer membrane protein OmpA-like peptidoglycan-associated protein